MRPYHSLSPDTTTKWCSTTSAPADCAFILRTPFPATNHTPAQTLWTHCSIAQSTFPWDIHMAHSPIQVYVQCQLFKRDLLSPTFLPKKRKKEKRYLALSALALFRFLLELNTSLWHIYDFLIIGFYLSQSLECKFVLWRKTLYASTLMTVCWIDSLLTIY